METRTERDRQLYNFIAIAEGQSLAHAKYDALCKDIPPSVIREFIKAFEQRQVQVAEDIAAVNDLLGADNTVFSTYGQPWYVPPTKEPITPAAIQEIVDEEPVGASSFQEPLQIPPTADPAQEGEIPKGADDTPTGNASDPEPTPAPAITHTTPSAEPVHETSTAPTTQPSSRDDASAALPDVQEGLRRIQQAMTIAHARGKTVDEAYSYVDKLMQKYGITAFPPDFLAPLLALWQKPEPEPHP